MTPDPDDKKSNMKKELPAREHSEYGEDDVREPPHPREEGDDQDPVKRVTGQGNASKGPYKEQGGEGHGENYGARKKENAGKA
jgi:hypothetical protein